ncbi:MAG: NfeD-like protein, partial [Clostridiales bacterium]|nr:NfeD-like protein [Clostridiales bacterium]
MSEWWEGLNLLQQVLYCIAIPSTLIMLIQTVLILIGIGSHGAG